MASEQDVVVFPRERGQLDISKPIFMLGDTNLRLPCHLINVGMYEQCRLLKQAIERATKYPFERFLIEDILERRGE